jgi:hypothetical protein
MPDARAILRRFRPAGSPGAAAPGGVPADRVAERDAELSQVFALLEDVEQERAALLAAARDAADAHRAAARCHADALRAEGIRRAAAERATAAAAVQEEACREVDAALGDARREADRIRHVAVARMPRLVAAAEDRMRGAGR